MTSGITQSVSMGAAVHATARPTDASTRLAGSIEKSSKIRKHLQDIADAASFSFAVIERDKASSASSKRVESAYSPKKGRLKSLDDAEQEEYQSLLDVFA